MTILETITSFETQALDGVKQAQDAVLGVAKSVADTVGPLVPEVPVSVPAQVPAPSAVVDNLFDFATKLLAANHAFAKQLVEAIAPLALIKSEAAKPARKVKVAA